MKKWADCHDKAGAWKEGYRIYPFICDCFEAEANGQRLSERGKCLFCGYTFAKRNEEHEENKRR